MATSSPVPAITEVNSEPRAQQVPLPMGYEGPFSRSTYLLKQLCARYGEAVMKNPEFVSKVESALKLASYLVPGEP